MAKVLIFKYIKYTDFRVANIQQEGTQSKIFVKEMEIVGRKLTTTIVKVMYG